MHPVELVWACDRLELFNRLEQENRDDTFALRGMLWFLVTGVVKEGHVFVDDWPQFRHVCCLHPSKLYSPTSDRDMLTMSTSDFSTFPDFFESMATLKKWRERQGVIMCYVEERIADLAERVLHLDSPRRGHFWKSQPMRHYTSLERQNFDGYLERVKYSHLKLTPGLVLDQLRPSEAHLVAEQWPYDIPEKEAMFRWLITILPSTAVRDPEGRPVAWAILYSFCAGGAAYILPHYRGKGLADVYGRKLTEYMLRMCPTQSRFFWILDDNVASQRQVERTSVDLRRTDIFVHWLSYTPGLGDGTKSKL